MIKHWSVTENENGIDAIYSGWENPVGGSLTPADEIDGLTPARAAKELETIYDSVKLTASKYYPTIICRKNGVTG